jgi:eukaryotic-like serine/threonine-protein kinase
VAGIQKLITVSDSSYPLEPAAKTLAVRPPSHKFGHDVYLRRGRRVSDLRTLVGELFAGEYEVGEELGGGGMSRLFLARDVVLKRQVVIKILPPELTSEMSAARFKREVEVTAHLQHPHILPIIGGGQRGKLLYYVMPYVRGESLRTRMKREGTIPVRDSLRIIHEIADALAYAHSHDVIHRDIKPENILLQGEHAVLADFGIAGALGAAPGERITRTGMSIGTVGYMAPEQSFEANIDARADIYSLGVVAFELLAGSSPFHGNTTQAILTAQLTGEPPKLGKLRPDVPRGLAQAVERALSIKPEDRFQSAAEFRDALEGPGTRVRHMALPPAPRVSRRVWYVAAGAVVAAAAAWGTVLYRNAKREQALAPEVVLVAIAPFATPDRDLELWREGMVDVMYRNLDGAGPLQGVPPTLAIKSWGQGRPDSMSAREFGERTRAEYVIFGMVNGSRQSATLSGSLLDIKTGELSEFEWRGPEVDQLAESLTVAVLTKLGTKHRIGAVRDSPMGHTTPLALKAFLQGEQHYRRTAWDSALAAYGRSASLDSSFALPLHRMGWVLSWVVSGADSLARAYHMRAGTLIRGLATRDSLLVTADSIMAANSESPDINWLLARRLFGTVDRAARRYPRDPEVWYQVGEAGEHHGYGSLATVRESDIFEAFDNAVALDSSFGPSYLHAIQYGFQLYGLETGRRYLRAYLARRPADLETDAMRVLDRLTAPRTTTSGAEVILRESDPVALSLAWQTIRRWPDANDLPLRVITALASRFGDHPDIELARSTYLPLQLAYLGRFRDSYAALGDRPTSLYAELVWLNAVPREAARATYERLLRDNPSGARTALPFWARTGDTASIAAYLRAVSNGDSGAASRSVKYSRAVAQAYLDLANRDSSRALERFRALSDTMCVNCHVDRMITAQLLERTGSPEEAAKVVSARLYALLSPMEVWAAAERGRLLERSKLDSERARAASGYRAVAEAWARGDPAARALASAGREGLKRMREPLTPGYHPRKLSAARPRSLSRGSLFPGFAWRWRPGNRNFFVAREACRHGRQALAALYRLQTESIDARTTSPAPGTDFRAGVCRRANHASGTIAGGRLHVAGW